MMRIMISKKTRYNNTKRQDNYNNNNVNITTRETIDCKIWVNMLNGYVELT